MACPISIGDAQQIVHYGVEIYQKIKNAEDEIKQAGIMLQELDDYLKWLRKLIEAKSTVASQLDPHWNELMGRITERMSKIKKECQSINRILSLFHDNMPMSKWVFPFGRNPKILRGLMEELQRHEEALYRELWSASLISDAPTAVEPGNAAVSKPAPPISRPLPPPSPKPVKKDCKIILVDPHNVGRSKVAEAYSKLLSAWTTGAGKPWPAKFAHSAGMALKSRSNCTELMEKVKYPIPMANGNHPPAAVAMDSLLDNKYYDAQFKAELRMEMMRVRRATSPLAEKQTDAPADRAALGVSTATSSRLTTTSSSLLSGSSRPCLRCKRPWSPLMALRSHRRGRGG